MLSIFLSYNNHRKIILFLSLGWRYRIKICRTKRHNKTKPGQWFSHTGYNSTAPAFCLEEQPCLLILLSRGPVCLKSSVRRSSMTHTYVVFRLLYGLLLFFVLGFLLVPGWYLDGKHWCFSRPVLWSWSFLMLFGYFQPTKGHLHVSISCISIFKC